MKWIHENPPHWDARKAELIGGAPAGTFGPMKFADGDLIPGEWWHVEDDGQIVGYGWMDCTWGDAEILLAVDADCRGKGVGTRILDCLEEEAASRGLNYLYNEVREGHPDREGLIAWLQARRFAPSHGEGLLKRRVRSGRS